MLLNYPFFPGFQVIAGILKRINKGASIENIGAWRSEIWRTLDGTKLHNRGFPPVRGEYEPTVIIVERSFHS